jgi:hypothetical protein
VLVLVEGLLVEPCVFLPGADDGPFDARGRAREIQALRRVAGLITAARAVGRPESGQRRN